ncbi:hypothetical protein CANARDRAFT_26395 [[Candida] arabinofermentans NRRL YB-2248]|uniref:Protein CCC1 n=1 Tax=[Candida] arabinofermentans NRRL YB-2248 TaxID=983967 RepID=A0A1E4T949_9ASCO|nr:hypothetical protein CANARDRAFT_26395 [[Candida] arabinofermentans NRRL YB-2248]
MSIVGLKKAISFVLQSSNETGSTTESNTSSSQSIIQNTDSSNYGSINNNDPESQLPIDNDNNNNITPTISKLDKDSKNDSSSSSQNNGFFDKVDPRVMSDVIIGLSDGLTVPFALTAGLSSLGDSKLVITGGMAELVSGAISMGLGGYLAARSEVEYYKSQVRIEKSNFFENPDLLAGEVEEIMLDMGASIETIDLFIRDLENSPQALIEFVIRFGKGLEEPAENRQLTSALTIGSGYFFGGFIPLVPYFFTTTVGTGLIISVIVMLITLFWFGYFKTSVSMGPDTPLLSKVSEGIQMVLIGTIAAGSAWSLVYFIDN